MRIAVLTGGATAERAVAFASAAPVVTALRSRGHTVTVVDSVTGPLAAEAEAAVLSPAVGAPPDAAALDGAERRFLSETLATLPAIRGADVVFLCLHGGRGEGGAVQTLLETIGVPYTGSGPLASALAMDKDLAKRVVRAAGVQVPAWLMAPAAPADVGHHLGWPAIVKPSKQGSSVGLTLVAGPPGLEAAIALEPEAADAYTNLGNCWLVKGDLARALEKSNHQVKIIERDYQRARQISEHLSRTVVLHGDSADEELLLEENVDTADVFVAVTNAEEANILSAMLAKRLGARKVMALINKIAYAELVESGTIDIAISPAQATIGQLLAHVRRGDVTQVHSLRRGAAEALEAVVHGDAQSCRLAGRRIEEVELPPGATIGAIVRGEQVSMAHHNTQIEPEDHVIVFVANKKSLPKVEKLFQVGVGFV